MTNTRDTNYEISKIHIAMETEIQREIKKCKLTTTKLETKKQLTSIKSDKHQN